MPFTFYCSSIKRSRYTELQGKRKNLHSTVVLLKVRAHKNKPDDIEEFTFYCSSIKRKLYQKTINYICYLHSTVVLLKDHSQNPIYTLLPNLHSTVVLLKVFRNVY